MEEDRDDRNTFPVYRTLPIKDIELLKKASIPFAIHYNTFSLNAPQRFDSNALNLFSCSECGSFYNQHCIKQQGNQWICSICQIQNYNETGFKLPEFNSESDEHTYEIEIAQKPKESYQSYLFLVDLCVSRKQLEAVKDTLKDFIKNANENTRIGLITYSQHVYVYNLQDKINTVVCIASHLPYSTMDIAELLGIDINSSNFLKTQTRKFLAKVGDSRDKILRKINGIRHEEDFRINKGKRQRAMRGVGQALNIGITIAQLSLVPPRVVTFIGGACTYGVGKVIGTDFTQQIRSIEDINKGVPLKYYKLSKNFYTNYLKQKILSRRIIVDMFIFSVEETGLTEMYDLIRVSGGNIVLGEQFSGQKEVFRKSFEKLYLSQQEDEPYNSGQGAILTVSCTYLVSINGILGQCYPLQNSSTYTSKKEVGFGGTNRWYLGSIDKSKTVTLVYEVNKMPVYEVNFHQMQEEFCIQFRMEYTDRSGKRIMKVTTLLMRTVQTLNEVVENFNQEAAVLTLARLHIYKVLYEDKINTKLWIDKILVQWASCFANYIKGDERSFTLPLTMKYLPQYIYYFRRSPIFRRSGISLDEYYYQCHLMNRQTIQNCLTMIQPALLAYSLECIEPKAVNLDQKQMKQSSILLLDTFLNVILWYGQNVYSWEEEGYHEKENYQHVKQLLEAPNPDIQYLLNNRFPYPALYKTYPNHSKERFLKSKVSPSKEIENENMISEDSDLVAFTSYLIDVIVNERLA